MALDGSSPSILMVERRVSMKLRKEKRGDLLTQTGLEDTDVVSQLEGPEQAAISAELRDKLSEGVGLLPEDVEVAVAMRDIQGLSNEEVADILEISVSALKARLHRGRSSSGSSWWITSKLPLEGRQHLWCWAFVSKKEGPPDGGPSFYTSEGLELECV